MLLTISRLDDNYEYCTGQGISNMSYHKAKLFICTMQAGNCCEKYPLAVLGCAL